MSLYISHTVLVLILDLQESNTLILVPSLTFRLPLLFSICFERSVRCPLVPCVVHEGRFPPRVSGTPLSTPKDLLLYILS